MCQKGGKLKKKSQPLDQTRLVYLCNSSIKWLHDQIATGKEQPTRTCNFPLTSTFLVAFLVNMSNELFLLRASAF